jgi:hypothetical protein
MKLWWKINDCLNYFWSIRPSIHFAMYLTNCLEYVTPYIKTRYFFKTQLIIYLHLCVCRLFVSGFRIKTSGYISVHTNTCHMHCPSHPPVCSTVLILKLLITQIYYVTFSLLDKNLCLNFWMSTARITY